MNTLIHESASHTNSVEPRKVPHKSTNISTSPVRFGEDVNLPFISLSSQITEINQTLS